MGNITYIDNCSDRDDRGKHGGEKQFKHVTMHSATQSSQFNVSFPEKFLKIVATGGEIFSLKFTK